MTDKLYFKYWAKAERTEEAEEPNFHLLPYHCLDVAAVAQRWWQKSSYLRRAFASQCCAEEEHSLAWVLFFISLHDLGKLDLRFQMKSPETTKVLQKDLYDSCPNILKPQIRKYEHGSAGYQWFANESSAYGFDFLTEDEADDWMACVAGHHGTLPNSAIMDDPPLIHPQFIARDQKARKQLVHDLAGMFLAPAGLSFSDIPENAPDFLAGFCSVCDWIGSNSEWFSPVGHERDVQAYYASRYEKADKALKAAGVFSSLKVAGGMNCLFPEYKPRGIQTLVDQFEVGQGLTIIEAPTGSGKTEAALAYAVKLLAAGLADSLVFALPSQATANAMLDRLEQVADRVFSQGKNVILAHGKSRWNKDFIDLQRAACLHSAQGRNEAQVQCAQWLASSRKRVFLGQVGVCTVDQVLLSVLPVRHQFVRSFGVRRSILIIDEVHAYDSYMYGLLQEVLKGQVRAGGSAILLSATLPSFQKESLLAVWGNWSGESVSEYPLITQSIFQKICHYSLPKVMKSDSFEVAVSLCPSPSLAFSDGLADEMIAKAEAGAMVAAVCNLVADAQELALRLGERTDIPVDLFHSRFRFRDRMQREKEVLRSYGMNVQRQGRILVATQVVEQSLDLDFDWLVTQLCPIDLLFQRLGRLHRHENERPACCRERTCTVLIPPSDSPLDLGDSQWVYSNLRALRRTHVLLEQNSRLVFPAAYRSMIEPVYQEESWPEESQDLTDIFVAYKQEQEASQYAASYLAHADSVPLADTDGNAATLTREGEMSLSVIPVLVKDGKRCCLDGSPLDDLNEFEQLEALNMEAVGVPQSWRKILPDVEEEQVCYLIMEERESCTFYNTETTLRYSRERGLEKIMERE